MWFRLCCLSLLLLHLPSRAAEIVGWRIPLSRYLRDGGRLEEMVKLGNPPEASPFFNPGDELHQLPNVTKDDKPLAEWIVWNATTGRLVVKGGLPAIRRVRNKIEVDSLASQVRLTFEIHDYPADGSMPDEKALPRYRHAFVVRSGQVMDYEARDEGLTFSFNGEAHFEEIIGQDVSQSPVEFRGALDVSTKDQGRLKVSNSVPLAAGGSMWLAGDTDGKDGILIKLTAEPVLTDGTPWREKLLRQHAGKMEPYVLDGGLIENRQVGEGWFSSWPLSEERFAGLVAQPETELDFSIYPEIPAPAALSEWVDTPVRDVSKVLRDLGVTIGEGDFIGHDPQQELLFTYSKNKVTADLIEGLFTSFCRLPWSAIALTVEDSGRTRLLCGGGTKATLERLSPDGTVMRALEIEPSENGEIIDARLMLFDQRNSAAKGSLKTSVSLKNGQFSEIWRDVTHGGQANVLRVKAETGRR